MNVDHGGRSPGSVHPGLRIFASSVDEPRSRRVTDAVLLGAAAVALLILSLIAVPMPRIGVALAELLGSLPDFLTAIWQILADGLVLLSLVLVAAAAVRRRWAILRDMAIAIAVGVVMWLVVARVVQGDWPAIGDSLRSATPPPWYPSPRILLPGAVILTAGPHLALPVRRLGRRLLALGAFAVAVLGASTPAGVAAGLLVAAMAAAVVHLLFGSSGGRPGLPFVEASLAELGIPVRSLGVADRQETGLFWVDALDEHGQPLVVKVYGRDAHDAALVSTLGRTVWYREAGAPLRVGRLQQVEHEAFVTLFARQAGIRTDRVVAAGATADDDALIVLRRQGQTLSEIGAPSAVADLPARIWALVGHLGDAGIAHGCLDAAHILADGDDLGLVGFRGATVGPTDVQRRSDEVQAFVTTVLAVGESPAIEAAVEVLGPARVEGLLPFLQHAVLTASQRHEVHQRELDLDELRAATAAAVDVEAPALVQLRRVTVGTLLKVLLPAIAVIVLVSGLSGLDVDELRVLLRDARWDLVALGLVVVQLPRVGQAVATLGSSPVPLPLGPVYALQLTVSFVNVAIPSAAARLAVNIRFFQRHGMSPGTALAAGTLDGFSGFIVQAILLTVLLLFSPASLDVDLGGAVDTATGLLVLVAIIAGIAIALVVAIGRLRRFVLEWTHRLAKEIGVALRGLRSPRRLAMLFGGNLASELLFALSLGIFVHALGASVGLAELLLVNIGVSLLAGVIPVPGGVGVVEGGLAWGLVQCGVPEEVAAAAAILQRLGSFYLPPIWGYFAMRWLERNGHL